ncbi:MAG: SRPBCC domain-containing protein [Sandaracinaceae bacterium]
MLQRIYRGETQIDAPPDVVWAVLVDLPRYGEWNPFTTGVRSSLQVGDPVELDVTMGGRTLQRVEYVRRVERAVALDWGMQMAGGLLLRAERTQRLTAVDTGTRYVTEDLIRGPLTPIVALTFGEALTRGFQSVAVALRDEVHRQQASVAR